MPDLLGTFKQKAEDLVGAINRTGGIKATIESVRKQMVVSDQRRAVTKAKGELKRLDSQITEMITAVGVQAVGLHKSGLLDSPELQPLCDHIVQLEAAVAKQKAELTQLEAQMQAAKTAEEKDTLCASCNHVIPPNATFCPYCGASRPAPGAQAFCLHCGAPLRENAKFCAKCGRGVEIAS